MERAYQKPNFPFAAMLIHIKFHLFNMNWIGHILHRNRLLQRITEGKIQGGIEVTGR
jgi:hypothetical protein